MAIQQRLADEPIEALGGEHLAVRIGFHCGEPIVHENKVMRRLDLSGNDVDQAARIEALACGGQVLVSEQVAVHLTGATGLRLHPHGPYPLKGLGSRAVFEVLWDDRQPLRPAGGYRTTVPQFLSEFVGRTEDLTRLADALRERRLVTLVGIGGVGKTRLAVEAASQLHGTELARHGIVFVPFAGVWEDTEDAVWGEAVLAMGPDVARQGDGRESVLASLKDESLILILDNCEAAVCSAASLAYDVLEACPAVRILATSQAPLELPGVEHQLALPPMALPAADATSLEAIEATDSFLLFAARARLLQGWRLDPARAEDLAEVLRLTDGIPLALEQVAAWVVSQDLAYIASSLRERRSRFLISSAHRPEAERHASMHACLDYTCTHLSVPEQEFAVALSVFAGGFRRDDAEAVAETDDTDLLLRQLTVRPLLQSEDSPDGRRYSFLPTVREHLADRLGEREAGLRARHSEHYLQLLVRLDDALRGAQPLLAMSRLRESIDDIRAGMDWAEEAGEDSTVVSYACALGRFLGYRGLGAERVSRCTCGLGAARRLADPVRVAACQNDLGIACSDLPTGDRAANLARAIECYQAALRVRTEQDFPADWATTQNNLGETCRNLPTGDRAAHLAKAIECFQAALRVRTEQDFPADWAGTQNNLAIAYKASGDHRRARACWQLAERGYRAAGLTAEADEVKRQAAKRTRRRSRGG